MYGYSKTKCIGGTPKVDTTDPGGSRSFSEDRATLPFTTLAAIA